jgi:hypothetical protein
LRRAVHAGLSPLARRRRRGGLATWNLGWLGHARWTILRHSAHTYPRETVSGDVGTGGGTLAAIVGVLGGAR